MTLLRQGKYELIREIGEVGSDKCQPIFIFLLFHDSKYSKGSFSIFFFFARENAIQIVSE